MEEQDFVPEIDAAAVQHVFSDMPPDAESGDNQMPLETSARRQPQTIEDLPLALQNHIQDLLADADAQGYLRGRNEQIEATSHFDDMPDDQGTLPPGQSIPVYNRRSIWD